MNFRVDKEILEVDYVMYTSKRLENVKGYALAYIKDSGIQDPAHGADHIMRVYDIGMQIGLEEKANLEVLGAAILFHDIIRPNDEKRESDHAIRSANLAKDKLIEFGYSEKEIELVADAIETSSRSGGNYVVPETVEAKILYDADKLDGGGEMGIKRTEALWRKRFESENKPYDDKIVARWYLGRIVDVLKTQPGFTPTAKRMLKERLKVSFSYCQNILGREFDDIMTNSLGKENVSRYI